MKAVKDLILDYQTMIAKMDAKLAQYEQMGTPEEIAHLLKVELTPIQESKIKPVEVKPRSYIKEVKKEEQVPTAPEVVEEIEKVKPKNIASDILDFLKG